MSDKKLAIQVENVSKQYRLGQVGTGTISHDLNRWWHKIRGKEDPYLQVGATNDRTKKDESQYVWALKDINFDIAQGDVVGIIGRNGAGKSTLLKVLSKVTGPTTGSIKYNGRIASLLEVGTGFHPELTGRENIYMNGTIMGMTKREVKSKLDEIVDFAGVAKYLDTPVKRYSSGMTVRLGFAVAAHLESEILIVDEVLAVGDAEFQKKAIGKMKSVSQGEGRSVLFVSHNMGAVRNLCKSGLILRNGQMFFSGTADEAVDVYLRDNSDIEMKQSLAITSKHRSNQVANEIWFNAVSFQKEYEQNVYSSLEDIPVVLDLESNLKDKKLRIAYSIHSKGGEPIGTFFSEDTVYIEKTGRFQILLNIKGHNLAKGTYDISFSVGTGNEVEGIKDYDVIMHTLMFEIGYKDKDRTAMYSTWKHNWGHNNFVQSEISIIK